MINVPDRDDDDDNDNDNERANIVKGYKTDQNGFVFFCFAQSFSFFCEQNMGVGTRCILSVWWRCYNTHRIHGTGIFSYLHLA